MSPGRESVGFAQRRTLTGQKRNALFVAIVVAAIGLVFVAGIFAGGVLSGSQLRTPSSSNSGAGPDSQALVIAGTETITVKAPDGDIVSTWTGPDPMQPGGINAIASCVSGGSDTPAGFGGCSDLIQSVSIYYGAGNSCTFSGACYGSGASATNSPTPTGCNPTSTNDETQLCTGWITTATFGPSVFTYEGACNSQCNLEAVFTGPSSSPESFSWICTSTYGGPSTSHTFTFSSTTLVNLPCQTSPSVSSFGTISVGDSLSVNIQFTIS
jgi:hypothetical protein